MLRTFHALLTWRLTQGAICASHWRAMGAALNFVLSVGATFWALSHLDRIYAKEVERCAARARGAAMHLAASLRRASWRRGFALWCADARAVHRSGVQRRQREMQHRAEASERARLLRELRGRVDPSLLVDA